VFRKKVQHIHFIGMGGVGMSGIAELLLNLGYQVSGSDLKESATTKRLASLGARALVGHRAENVGDADVVVYSSAVSRDNPEIVAARARGIPVIRRAEMLAELMRLKYGIAVAGSHGKTTTTSLVATVLTAAGLDPTVVIGGRLNALGANAKLGAGELLVAEADESDGSFLHLTPTVAVVTNIDPEHLDHHGTYEKLQDTFVDFIQKVPFYGLAVLCLDHPGVQALLPRVDRRVATYGFSAQADWRARDVQFEGLDSRFEVVHAGQSLGRFAVRMPGPHSVLNCLATLAVAEEMGVGQSVARDALASFGGVDRRFTIVGDAAGVLVVDDYGHHPAEIRATLEAAQRGYRRRVVVGFQPHRYTRTRDLWTEFETAFNRADVVYVTDIYAAGEPRIEGIDSEKLVTGIRVHGHKAAVHVPGPKALLPRLAADAKAGDLVLLLGAGDIGQIGPALVDLLAKR
jgi:UDP-N-acetylmuramate--alanine ligase